jgi:hypothetical protein
VDILSLQTLPLGLAFSASKVGDHDSIFTFHGFVLGPVLVKCSLFKGPTGFGDVFEEHFVRRKIFG